MNCWSALIPICKKKFLQIPRQSSLDIKHNSLLFPKTFMQRKFTVDISVKPEIRPDFIILHINVLKSLESMR